METLISNTHYCEHFTIVLEDQQTNEYFVMFKNINSKIELFAYKSDKKITSTNHEKFLKNLLIKTLDLNELKQYVKSNSLLSRIDQAYKFLKIKRN